MATYFSFPLSNGKCGVARVFVQGGSDEVQVTDDGGSVASFTAEEAQQIAGKKNQRLVEEAQQIAAKRKSGCASRFVTGKS